jgi:hypothetical protein
MDYLASCLRLPQDVVRLALSIMDLQTIMRYIKQSFFPHFFKITEAWPSVIN